MLLNEWGEVIEPCCGLLLLCFTFEFGTYDEVFGYLNYCACDWQCHVINNYFELFNPVISIDIDSYDCVLVIIAPYVRFKFLIF